MIRKYLVTDYKGKEIYFETFSEEEANMECAKRRLQMDAYVDWIELTMDDIQAMNKEELFELYEHLTGDEITEEEADEEFWEGFWDMLEEELA